MDLRNALLLGVSFPAAAAAAAAAPMSAAIAQSSDDDLRAFCAADPEEDERRRFDAFVAGRNRHYTDLYSALVRNVEAKTAIMAHEQDLCETSLAFAPELPRRAALDALTTGFARSAALHETLLSALSYPASLVYAESSSATAAKATGIGDATRTAFVDGRAAVVRAEAAVTAFLRPATAAANAASSAVLGADGHTALLELLQERFRAVNGLLRDFSEALSRERLRGAT